MLLPTKLISLNLAVELLAKIDALAAREYHNRSEFIRQAIMDKIRMIEAAKQAPPGAPSAPLIVEDSVNILMSDDKLETMFEAIKRERSRRWAVAEMAKDRRTWRQ